MNIKILISSSEDFIYIKPEQIISQTHTLNGKTVLHEIFLMYVL